VLAHYSLQLAVYNIILTMYLTKWELPGNPYRRGTLSTVDLLVLTILDQLFFIKTILFTIVKKQATLMRRSTVLSRPIHLVIPAIINKVALLPWQTNAVAEYFMDLPCSKSTFPLSITSSIKQLRFVPQFFPIGF